MAVAEAESETEGPGEAEDPLALYFAPPAVPLPGPFLLTVRDKLLLLLLHSLGSLFLLACMSMPLYYTVF